MRIKYIKLRCKKQGMGQYLKITLFSGDGPISKHFKRREYGFRSGICERKARAASKEKLAERL